MTGRQISRNAVEKRETRTMKKMMTLLNGAIAAMLLLSPAAIFAAPADGNRGEVQVDSASQSVRTLQDDNFQAGCDNVFVHGYNVVDSDGTFSIHRGARSTGGVVEESGTWHGTKSSGNGFDFTAGPFHLASGAHDVEVWDTDGLSDKEHAKDFTVSCGGTSTGCQASTSADAAVQKADAERARQDAEKAKSDAEAASTRETDSRIARTTDETAVKSDAARVRAELDAEKAKAERDLRDAETAARDADHASRGAAESCHPCTVSGGKQSETDSAQSIADSDRADADAAQGAADRHRADTEKSKADQLLTSARLDRDRADKEAAAGSTHEAQLDRDRADAEQSQADAERKVSDADRERADAEDQSSRAEHEKADAEKVKANADHEREGAGAGCNPCLATGGSPGASTTDALQADADNREGDAARHQADADKQKASAESHQSDADRARSEADRAAAEKDTIRATDEKASADADRARGDNTSADTEKAVADSDRARADAERQKADAEQQKADAEKSQSEADKDKSDKEGRESDADHKKAGHEGDHSNDCPTPHPTLCSATSGSNGGGSSIADDRAALDDHASATSDRKGGDEDATRASDENRRSSEVALRAQGDHELADRERAAGDTHQADLDQARADDEQKQADAERAQSHADQEKADSEHQRADAEDARSTADKARADVERQRETGTSCAPCVASNGGHGGADQSQGNADAALADATRKDGKSDVQNAKAEHDAADADTQRAQAERARAEHDRARADEEQAQSESDRAAGDSARADAEKSQADADRATADNEKAQADAEQKRGDDAAARAASDQKDSQDDSAEASDDLKGARDCGVSPSPSTSPSSNPESSPSPATSPSSNPESSPSPATSPSSNPEPSPSPSSNPESSPSPTSNPESSPSPSSSPESSPSPATSPSSSPSPTPGGGGGGGNPKAKLAIHKSVSPATGLVATGSTLAYTLDIANTGDAAGSTAVVDQLNPSVADMVTIQDGSFVISPPSCGGSVTIDAPRHQVLWGTVEVPSAAHCALTFNVTVTRPGSLQNLAAIGGEPPVIGHCSEPTCSTVSTTVTPAATGVLVGKIVDQGTGSTVTGGSIVVGGESHPNPYTSGPLAAGQYCVAATPPLGYTLVSTSVATAAGTGALLTELRAASGAPCVAIIPNQTTTVVFTVTQVPQTACVPADIVLAGTNLSVPGGAVVVGTTSQSTYPFTFCGVNPGPVTVSATAPAGFTFSGPSGQTVTLVAGNNPAVVFQVQPTQQVQGSQCGSIMADIVQAGTGTVVPGGTITVGTETHPTYPLPLFSCSNPGPVTVTATAPAGYQFTGPSTTSATIVGNQVTPVVFQVQPIGGQGSGNPANTPASTIQGVQNTQHAPTSGVLGTSIGMPMTGSEVILRMGFSIVCLGLGLVLLRTTVQRRKF
ncbi:MAG: hypothetical protein ACYDGR_01180 [Candidatus Dormibacteria bacterium]